MSNQRRYFAFILTLISVIFVILGLFVYLPSVSILNKPTGQVLGVKEVKAPDIDPFENRKNLLSDDQNEKLELRINLDTKHTLLMTLPKKINNQNAERDRKQFYITCPNAKDSDKDINIITPEFTTDIQAGLKSNTIKPANIKNFLKIKQATSIDNCKFSELDISKIIDDIEIRSFDFDFQISQLTSRFSTDSLDYLLTGNCVLNGVTKDQIEKFIQPCSLWSLGKDQIYPNLLTSNLRQWFPNGDISFYTDPTDPESKSTPETPFRLVNIDAIKREANIFYLKNGELKLIDLKEVKNINQFSSDFTLKSVTLPDSPLADLFYRKNQLPILPLSKELRDQPTPNQKIACAWTSVTQDEFWYRENLPQLPLQRTSACNIGQLIQSQNPKNMKISPDELTNGDSWYLDKSVLFFNQTVFDAIQTLGYQSVQIESICQTGNTEKLFFERQLCPFGVTNTDDLNNLTAKLETNSQKVDRWNVQDVDKDDYSYRIYTKVTDNGLWVYWFKLTKDTDLSEKRIELNRIMEKVSIR